MRDNWTIALVLSIFFLLIASLIFFYPLIDGIIMGIVFSYVAKPVKNRITEKIGNFFSSIVATLLIILPISFLMFYGAFQGLNQLIFIITHQSQYTGEFITALTNAGVEERYLTEIQRYLSSLVTIVQDRIRISAIDVTLNTVMFLTNFLISSIVCYYVLLDGGKFFERALRVFPDDRRSEFRSFLLEVDETYLGLWSGNFVVAVVIGIASIPFFFAFNIPFVPLLSGLMFLAALIPVLAEWMILAVITLFLALNDLYLAAWFMGLGFLLLYFIPELILRPYFVGYTSKIHPLVLMLAFIGGAIVGGLAGFFIAPMLAGLITALYNYYTK